MKIILLLNFLIATTLANPLAVPQGKHTLAKRDWELGHSGNYHFVGCDAYTGGLLTQVLQSLYNSLLPVVQDAVNSQKNPSDAYRAFFKDPANAVFVAQVFSNVTQGNAMHPPTLSFTNGNPTFICMKPGRSFHYIMSGKVMDAAVACADPNHSIAFYLHPTPFIVLCNTFFTGTMGPQTPVANNCPTVNHAINKFRKKTTDLNVAGLSLIHNQMWAMLEEIVHYYLFAQPSITSLKPEAYDINEAWRLSATQAMSNAVNYAYYAGFIFGACNDFPSAPGDGRELIEATPDPDDPTDVNPGTANGIPEDVEYSITDVQLSGTVIPDIS